jgi:hypothetical protein
MASRYVHKDAGDTASLCLIEQKYLTIGKG